MSQVVGCVTDSPGSEMQQHCVAQAVIKDPTLPLPVVHSMTWPPGCSRPEASAASNMARAGRSLALPPGLEPSSLIRMVLLAPGLMGRCRCCRRTMGVLPTTWSTVGHCCLSVSGWCSGMVAGMATSAEACLRRGM